MKLKEKKSRPKPTNCGRFQKKGIKVVGKWKEVKIDPNMFADGQMDDLVCFEELTDYRLVSPAKSSSSLFSKGESKKREAGRGNHSTFPWGWDCHRPASWKEEMRTEELGVAKPQGGSAYITLMC